MNKMFNYIKHNKVFILLLSVVLFITAGLGVYYVNNVMELPNNDQDAVDAETTTKKSGINSFQGVYDSNTRQIRMSWSVQQGEEKITALKLYNNQNFLADVTNLNSYVLNQTVYQFPGGENNFILKAQLDNGEEKEREAKVTVDYFSTITCTTENSDIGIFIKLTYTYQQGVDIKVPRIVVNSMPYGYTFNYRESKKEEPKDGYITETTIFEVDSRMAGTEETVNTRWVFDSIGMSYDFPVLIPAKGTKGSPKAD